MKSSPYVGCKIKNSKYMRINETDVIINQFTSSKSVTIIIIFAIIKCLFILMFSLNCKYLLAESDLVSLVIFHN